MPWSEIISQTTRPAPNSLQIMRKAELETPAIGATTTRLGMVISRIFQLLSTKSSSQILLHDNKKDGDKQSLKAIKIKLLSLRSFSFFKQRNRKEQRDYNTAKMLSC